MTLTFHLESGVRVTCDVGVLIFFMASVPTSKGTPSAALVIGSGRVAMFGTCLVRTGQLAHIKPSISAKNTQCFESKTRGVADYYAALLPRRGRILRRTLSVRPSVRPSRYR